MKYTQPILAAAAILALAAPVMAAEADTTDTNAHTAASASVSAATPDTGVNVGTNALGKNTVKSGNSKGARAARGYDQTVKASTNVHAGANADAGVKNHDKEDHQY